MNRVLRHRLRNLCAGLKMTADRIAEVTASTHPNLSSRCGVINSEMDNLFEFTARMDLLFDSLPSEAATSLFDLISSLRADFVKKYPLCNIELGGPELELVLPRSSWLRIALWELIKNAAEAAGGRGSVEFAWARSQDGGLYFAMLNPGEIPPEIPLAPPAPFNTQRSRHDGLGLAIAWRICKAMNAEFIIDAPQNGCVAVKLHLPPEECTDGQSQNSAG